MALLDDLVSRISHLEQRLDRLADTEIVPFNICCRVYNSGDIAISHNTVTALTFDTEAFDTDNMHSTVTNTERLTVQTAGKYAFIGQVRWQVTSGGRRQVQIAYNASNSVAITEDSSVADSTSQPYLNVATIYEMAVGDYMVLRVYQTSGSSLNVVNVGVLAPAFVAFRIA